MNSITTQPLGPAKLEIIHSNPSPSCNLQGAGIAAIVLHDAGDAKEKLLNANAAEKTITAIVSIGRKRPALMSALVECVCTENTATAIAQRYSIHESTLSLWIRRVGLRAHPRGRRALKEPTPEHKHIIELVRAHGGAEAARRSGISKQWVSRIVHKWEPRLGRRRALKIAIARPIVRRPRRNFVVSFRITKVEWNRLQAAQIGNEGSKLSGPSKARQIILNHIAPSDGDGCKLANSSLGLASGKAGTEVANVHTQATA